MFDPDLTSPMSQSRDSFDNELSKTMRDVPIPGGLLERLQRTIVRQTGSEIDQATDTSTQPAAASTSAQPVEGSVNSQRRRSWHLPYRLQLTMIVSAVACVMIALIAPALMRKPMLNESLVRQLASLDASTIETGSPSTLGAIPDRWASIPGLTLAGSSRLVRLDNQAISVVPLTYRSHRRLPAATGLIVAIPQSQWATPVEGVPFWQAEIHYSDQVAWIAWREETTIFIVMMRGGSRILEDFQHSVAATNRNVT